MSDYDLHITVGVLRARGLHQQAADILAQFARVVS